MEIIALEGIDKSGKHTQAKKLFEALKNKGYRVEKTEFHRYDTPTGRLIRQWLNQEWDVDQSTIEFIMAADKQAQQRWFEKLDEQGYDYLIIDRYTLSQEVYAIANGLHPHWVNQLQRYMRQPNLEILIDIPPEESMKRKGKFGENDRYESDKALLTNVRDHYLKEARAINRANWKQGYVKVIDGMQTVEPIHQEIVNFVFSDRH